MPLGPRAFLLMILFWEGLLVASTSEFYQLASPRSSATKPTSLPTEILQASEASGVDHMSHSSGGCFRLPCRGDAGAEWEPPKNWSRFLVAHIVDAQKMYVK